MPISEKKGYFAPDLVKAFALLNQYSDLEYSVNVYVVACSWQKTTHGMVHGEFHDLTGRTRRDGAGILRRTMGRGGTRPHPPRKRWDGTFRDGPWFGDNPGKKSFSVTYSYKQIESNVEIKFHDGGGGGYLSTNQTSYGGDILWDGIAG